MGEGGTVLVAEDDRDQREILSEVLEYEGFKVITAASPKQLVERLTPEIDLVLLDVNGVHAPEVDAALGRLGRNRPSILVVSGDCRAEDAANAMAAQGWLAKPYELGDLLRKIGELITGRGRRLRVLDGGLGFAPAL
ncbi:MAG: response regulator [Myxococcaceae bacterium]